jgi:hypothetical protein
MPTIDDSYGSDYRGLPLFEQQRPAGPFAESKIPPSPEEIMVASFIWKHRGRSNPISIAQLRDKTGYTERQIKGIVEQLVTTHKLRIGANREEPVGYFVVESAEDLAAAVRPYRNQIIAMWRRLRVLESRSGLRELLGQLTLED